MSALGVSLQLVQVELKLEETADHDGISLREVNASRRISHPHAFFSYRWLWPNLDYIDDVNKLSTAEIDREVQELGVKVG